MAVKVLKYSIIDSRAPIGNEPRFRDMLLEQRFTEAIEVEVNAPASAAFFSFGVQEPKPTVFMLVAWALADDKAAIVPRRMVLCLTGHKLDRWLGHGNLIFVGSVRVDAEEGSWRGPDAQCHQFHLFEYQEA